MFPPAGTPFAFIADTIIMLIACAIIGLNRGKGQCRWVGVIVLATIIARLVFDLFACDSPTASAKLVVTCAILAFLITLVIGFLLAATEAELKGIESDADAEVAAAKKDLAAMKEARRQQRSHPGGLP